MTPAELQQLLITHAPGVPGITAAARRDDENPYGLTVTLEGGGRAWWAITGANPTGTDHYHPWVEVQGHSAFTWNLLSAIAMKTDRIGLATRVTCASMRYHPAIIAQAAATLAIISDGRFTLGVGAGERLNEHVTGEGFPARRVRHERFREALEIIRLLWRGGYRSYDGQYLKLEDARCSTCRKNSR
jgi:G6PDH family F420-dependent oxidoreductase